MAKGWCEECQQLVGISPTGERQHAERGTSQWWRFDAHHDERAPDRSLCAKSGAKV